MNNIKDFFVENKKLVMMTASILMGIFIIFSVIVIISSTSGKKSNDNNQKGTDDATTKNIVEDETSTTLNTSEEEGKIDETTQAEKETEPPVDPYTLPYAIRVNRAMNCITVYSKDSQGKFTVPEKAITCSTGKDFGDNATPLGNYTTLVSYKWLLMVDNSYGQYAYRFYGPYLFHSVPYFSKDKGNLEWEQYNKLGEVASLGCVRMNCRDAIWLIEKCREGTLVEIYDDTTSPGPLGKPDTIKIPSDSPYRGWDPTDPEKNNPWHAFSASITAQKTVTVEEGSTLQKVLTAAKYTAKDTCGNDITSKVTYDHNIKLDTVGTYKLTLNVTDAIDSKATIDVEVKIIKKQEATTPTTPKSTSVKITVQKMEVTVDVGSDINAVLALVGATAKDSNGKSVAVTPKHNIDFNTADKYELTLEATDTSRNTDTVVVKVIVKAKETEKKESSITAEETITVRVDSTIDEIKAAANAKATDINGDDITNKITPVNTIDTSIAGEYTLTLGVVDSNGSKKTTDVKVIVIN